MDWQEAEVTFPVVELFSHFWFRTERVVLDDQTLQNPCNAEQLEKEE